MELEIVVCGKIFKLNDEEIKIMGFFNNIVNDLGLKGPIEIKSFKSDLFEIILEYVHALKSQEDNAWKKDYFAKHQKLLGKILQVSEFLDITQLCQDVSKEIVKSIQSNETKEEMCENLNVKDEISPENKEKVEEKLSWV